MARIDDLRLDHETTDGPQRRERRRLLRGGAIGGIAVAILAVVWFAAGVWRDPQPVPAAAEQPTAGLSPASQPPAGGFTAGGYVEIVPPGPVVVAARVAGWVRTIEVVEGARVASGEVLATLDDTVPRQALAEAAAEVALARAHLARLRAGFRSEEVAESAARLEQAAARAQHARTEAERAEQLVAIGAAPERRLAAARAEHAAAEAELAGAQALLDLRRAGQRPEDIAVAEAELARAVTREERLAWQLEQCVVRAPAAGVVLERFVRVGDWVAPDQGGARSGALLTLFDPERLQVWVEVNQRDADRVTVGQPVGLRADAWRDRTIAGRIVQVMPSANLQRNTVEVKIAFAAAEHGDQAPWLRPQMSVQVTFLVPDQSTRKDTP